MERPVTGAEDFAPLHPGSDGAPAEYVPVPAPAVEHGVVVEVLGSQGQVRSRVRLTTLPATLGRGYDADVLVDDPHVCARHAELRRTADGSLILTDLGSVNGIGHARGERVAELQLASGDRVRLGPVELRVVEATHPVADAVPVTERRGLTTTLNDTGRALAVTAGAFVAFTLLNYQSSTESEALVTAVQEGVYMVAGVALWASAWALATRIVSRAFRFLSHWAWALGVLLVGLLLTVIGEWIDFVGPSLELGTWLAAIGGLALLPVLIAGHLEIASSMSSARRWRAALATGGIVIALTAIASLGEDDSEDTWSLDYSGTLKPLPVGLLPTASLDDFMQASGSLQEEVDAMAEEELPDDAVNADSTEAVTAGQTPALDSTAK